MKTGIHLMARYRHLTLSIFLISFFIPARIQAQEFKMGWQAGLSFTQVDGDKLSGYNKLGPHLGVFVERAFGEKWRLRPEFLLTVKGAKNYIDANNIDNPLKTSFYYVEVPLLLNYREGKIQIEAGPSFGVLTYASSNDRFGKYRTTERYDRLEWAAHIGVSYLWKQTGLFYVRYSYSLDCIDGNCGSLFTNPKIRPGYFHNVISLGYRSYFR